MSCPTHDDLTLLLDLRLAAGPERGLRAHVLGCSSCHAWLLAREPSWLFTVVRPRTLAEADWDDVMAAVQAEVRSNPRRVAATRPGWGTMGWLTGLAAAAAVVLVLFLDRPRVALHPLAVDKAVEMGEFVWLSNPAAEHARVVIAGDPSGDPVTVTMVVDPALAELF